MAQLPRLQDPNHRRSKTRVVAFLNIVGVGMREGRLEQNLQDMEVQPTAEMAMRHKGVIVGIKSAHFNGPEWTPYEKAEEVGRLANIPVMVDFGGNVRAGRTLDDLLNKYFSPGDIFTHMYGGVRGEQDEHKGPKPGDDRWPQARRHLRRRPRRRQLQVVHGDSVDESRLHSGFDLDGSSREQHERRHEEHARRDEQVPR